MGKEKSRVELLAEKKDLKARSSEIINAARSASRQFTEAENKELGEIQARMAEIVCELQDRAAELRGEGASYTPVEKFSLRRAIVARMNKTGQRDSEAAVLEAAMTAQRGAGVSTGTDDSALYIPLKLEQRAAYTAAVEAAKGAVIDEDKQELLLPLEANLVLSQAGVRMMTGLRGNISWPEHTAAQVFWEGENDEAKDGAGEFKKGKLFSPHRLTAQVKISRQLLVQENRDVEGLLRQLLAVALAQKIEQTALGKAAHEDNVPDGLFQTLGDIKGAMSWDNVVAMETSADLNNALFGNLAYIMHPALVGKAKTKVKDPSGAGGFIFGNDGTGMLNGYRALRTNNVPSGLREGGDEYGIVFGNWGDYFIGQWGSLELTVDPYTLASSGMVRLIMNSYWDMGVIRPESFSVGSLK